MLDYRAHKSQDFFRTTSARRSRRSLRSGYAFAHQEGFGKLITSGKIMRKTVLNFGKSSTSSNNNSSVASAMTVGTEQPDGNPGRIPGRKDFIYFLKCFVSVKYQPHYQYLYWIHNPAIFL